MLKLIQTMNAKRIGGSGSIKRAGAGPIWYITKRFAFLWSGIDPETNKRSLVTRAPHAAL